MTLTDPKSPFFRLAADMARSAHNAAMAADAKPSKPPRVTEHAYARAEAASAIVKAVTRWRRAKAGTPPDDATVALTRVWEAGERYEALADEEPGYMKLEEPAT